MAMSQGTASGSRESNRRSETADTSEGPDDLSIDGRNHGDGKHGESEMMHDCAHGKEAEMEAASTEDGATPMTETEMRLFETIVPELADALAEDEICADPRCRRDEHGDFTPSRVARALLAHVGGSDIYTALLETVFAAAGRKLAARHTPDKEPNAEVVAAILWAFCRSDGDEVLQTLLEACARMEEYEIPASLQHGGKDPGYDANQYLSTRQMAHILSLLNPRASQSQIEQMATELLNELETYASTKSACGLHSMAVRGDSVDETKLSGMGLGPNFAVDTLFGNRTHLEDAGPRSVRNVYRRLIQGKGHSHMWPVQLVQSQLRKKLGGSALWQGLAPRHPGHSAHSSGQFGTITLVELADIALRASWR